jgi:hypothetical protein
MKMLKETLPLSTTIHKGRKAVEVGYIQQMPLDAVIFNEPTEGVCKDRKRFGTKCNQPLGKNA